MKRFPFKKVETFCHDLRQSVFGINWGGCAVSAHLLANALESHVDEVKIVAYDNYFDNRTNIDEVRKDVKSNTVRSWNSVGIAFHHVWVEFKRNGRWHAIDSSGLRSRKDMRREWGKPFRGSFSIKEMKELSSTQSGWNSTFDRRQIPRMRKMINKELQSVLAS